jgi:hypothetical protein
MTVHPQPQTFATELTPLEATVLSAFDVAPLHDGTSLIKILAGERALTRKEFSRTRQAGEDALIALQKAGLLARDKRGWWYKLPQ